MPIYRKVGARLTQMQELFSRNDNWLIIINADPDAIASAMALKRIMSRRTGKVFIARINEITRPDNLTMLRQLYIPLVPWSETLLPFFQKFALVDSQPHHSPIFQDIPFSIVIDHHPIVPEFPSKATYSDIRTEYGATSTIFTEYLRSLHIRPGRRLATALQYGIRTDTGTFTRKFTDADIRAYQWLAKHASNTLLIRITRSEYLQDWLKYFTRAFTSLHDCGKGKFAFLGNIENPDILVVVGDFFTKVYGLKWTAICGVYKEQVVIVFRGDESIDLGKFASERFSSLGSAGGHRAMARAEFPLKLVEGKNLEVFIFRKLSERLHSKKKNSKKESENNEELPTKEEYKHPSEPLNINQNN